MSVFSKLIPAPQKVELGEGTYKLTSKTVKTNFDATNDFKYLLGELGLPVASICDCKADFLKMVIGEGCITDAAAPDNKEGYTLVLRENGAEITANTKEGIAFGLKTLIKLQELNEEIPQATITDYPNLPFRGVHLCIFNPDDGTEKDDTSFESTMKVVKTAAMTGYNTVCVEFWGMFPNPRREYAYWPKAYTMEQVKALVSFIKDDLYMEAFPCQNLTSHAGWSRIDSRKHVVLDQRPDLKDMWIPGGWCFATENPDTKEYLKDIMEELIIAFRNPKYFHISTDKAFGFGSGLEDRTRPADVLFMNHVTWLNTFLQEKGIIPVMWNDMIYSSTDSLFWKMDKKMADYLPNNILMNVWTHNDPGEYWPDAVFFEDRGFKTVYSPFMHEGSIIHMVEIANKAKNAEGILQTTWFCPIQALPYVTMSGGLQWSLVRPDDSDIKKAVDTWYK